MPAKLPERLVKTQIVRGRGHPQSFEFIECGALQGKEGSLGSATFPETTD